MEIKLVLVTPEVAASYLEKNDKNRKSKDRLIARLSDSMERGEWRLTSETIKFDINGNLIDGQHRLKAIIKSGTSQKFMVSFGEDPENFSVIDDGVPRTGGDALYLSGYENGNNVAAACNLVICYKKGFNYGMRHRVPNIEVVNFVNANPRISGVVKKCTNWYKHSAGLMPLSFMASLYFIVSESHPAEVVDSFFEKMFNGLGVGLNTFYAKWRQRMAKDKVSITKLPRETKTALFVKAWNAHLSGGNKKLISYDSAKEKFPKIN